eukprot:8571620-Ditylum_brightwellii.AAC.1
MKERVLRQFSLEDVEDVAAHKDEEGKENVAPTPRYTVKISNNFQYDLATSMVANLTLFQATVMNLQLVKDTSDLGALGSCNLGNVIKYDCIVCAHAMQLIKDILKKSW